MEDRPAGKKYVWSRRQEEVIMPLVRARATATIILRELEQAVA